MLIEKYCDNEDWRAGYREACFDLCVGNLDKDKAFELARDVDEEDMEEENEIHNELFKDDVICYDDENSRFRHIFSDEEDEGEDCCKECDMWNLGYKHGYEDGLKDGYEDALEEDEEAEEFPEEIVLDAAVFNNIEELKTNIRTTINALHKTNTPTETINQLWDVVSGLVELEKRIAGNEVLDYYINYENYINR